MSTLDDVRGLLAQITTAGSFATRRTAPAADLHLSVKGVGPIRLPVTATQALELRAAGRPARHGYKDETRLDRRVRDTWEIPRSRITIDQRAWSKTLLPQLDGIRRDLGLLDGARLKADLYNMLVYEPGQFFVTHQDSEKADGMIGTLVVILPSTFTGGEIVVEHHDERVTFGAAKGTLTFVAFYADCHHQVRPITRGYRVALTYNLILEGSAAVASGAASRATDALAEHVRRFFDTLMPARWLHDKDRERPDRLVYLLDHEYTQRGLGWKLLKNADAARAAALWEVARRLDCEIVLALADVHETWSCEDADFDYGWRSRGEWGWHEDDDEDDEGDRSTEPDDSLELIDLIDSDVELRHGVAPDGPADVTAARVDAREVCWTKASSEMKPFQSEREGYTGNAGNTLDRWYHRAAVVLWPRERTFVIRARASAGWAVGELARAIKTGRLDEARQMAERLRPFWARTDRLDQGRALFDRTLRVAAGIEGPELAAMLLQPFRLEQITPASAPRFAALLERYGFEWCRTLLADWSRAHRPRHDEPGLRAVWLASTLPDLCRTLCAVESPDGIGLAREIVGAQWAWITGHRKDVERYMTPKEWAAELTHLCPAFIGLLEGSVTASLPDLQHEVLSSLTSAEHPLAARVHLLRTAHERCPAGTRRALGLAALHALCVEDLVARLSAPVRADDDWSIAESVQCPCDVCATLMQFLRSPAEITRAWPLSTDRRAHVHDVIDRHGLPVSHVTRRTGRPFTLVLTKTRALFEAAAAERQQWKDDLAWLKRTAAAF